MNASVERDGVEKAAPPELMPLYRFWQPRYWGLWLAVLMLRLVTLLPFRWQMRIGQALGRLAMPFVPKRRRIAEVNLRLCFPQLDEDAIEGLVREHFESIGMSIIEMGLAWFVSAGRARKLVEIIGYENLEREIAQGHPVILLSGHFPGNEIVGIAARQRIECMGAMYRSTNNLLADQIIRRGRQRSLAYLIPKEGLRQLLKVLKSGVPVWYASDQAYDRKNSALVPFFGVPAMTNCALTQIARMSNARVVPFLPSRRADLSGYDARVLPPLENFPTDDPVADALLVHRVLEEHIREAPAQYYWLHRRFKNRPPPLPNVYADA